jgi:hypothetical protein
MTTEAVEFTPFSYGLTEDEKIKEQQELIDELDNPDTLKSFVKACKEIGQTAVAIDKDFVHVKNGFADLVKKYGKDFPRVNSEFLPRWDGFKARWEGEKGLLWSSRSLAAKTAATLTDYGINLQLVAEIVSVRDLKEAQAELQQYTKTHPVTIATTVADGFKDLKHDITRFSEDFSKYLEEEKQTLTEQAKQYEADIKKYQGEVDDLNQKIKKTLITLGATAVFGVSLIITGGFLISYLLERKKAQDNLDKADANLKGVIGKQNALAAMQADFEQLRPHIHDICTKLGVFAEIWAFMTEQSIEIDTALNEGTDVVSTKKFQIKLELLQKQIVPLKEGMKAYATQIV